MPRLSGQVSPRVPPTAPLSYRLSEEVYALDGDTDYMVAPGARLKMGPHGRLYETLGQMELEPYAQAQVDIMTAERGPEYEVRGPIIQKVSEVASTVKKDVKKLSTTTLIVLGVAAYLLWK